MLLLLLMLLLGFKLRVQKSSETAPVCDILLQSLEAPHLNYGQNSLSESLVAVTWPGPQKYVKKWPFRLLLVTLGYYFTYYGGPGNEDTT